MSTPLPFCGIMGSNKKDLMMEYHEAYQAAKNAAEQFNSVHFHARDYSGQDFIEARKKREEMSQKLCDVLQYLETHTMELL